MKQLALGVSGWITGSIIGHLGALAGYGLWATCGFVLGAVVPFGLAVLHS